MNDRTDPWVACLLILGIALMVWVACGALLRTDAGRTPCDVDTPEQRAYCQHVTGHPARARRMWR